MGTATALVGPTRERVRKASDFEAPVTDQKRRRVHWRMLSTAETMHNAGKLSDEQLNAFKRFERDLSESQSGRRVIARYGAEAGTGGTPLLQLSEYALTALSPEERRSDAYDYIKRALAAVGEPRSVELLIVAATEDMTLESLGRSVLCIGNKAQATAAAQRTLQTATYALAQHYGYIAPLKPPE